MTGRTWVVWCGPQDLDPELAAALRARQEAGDRVEERPYAVAPALSSSWRGRVAGAVARVFGRGPAGAAAGPGPAAVGGVTGSGAGFAVHLAAEQHRDRLTAEQHRDRLAAEVGHDVLDRRAGLDLLGQAQRWDAVDRSLRLLSAQGEREPVRPKELIGAVRGLLAGADGSAVDPRLGADPMPVRLARLRTVCRRLVRQNRHAQARDLLGPVLAAWGPDPAFGLHALSSHAETSLTGTAPPDLPAAATAALEGADRALADGDRDLAAELVTIGAGLLLHRDLHADTDHSPLVDDTAAFLAPLRGSRAMAALAGPRPVEVPLSEAPLSEVPPPSEAHAPPGSRPTRVVVLPGAYQRFAAPLVAELDRRPGVAVQVVDLAADHPAFRWLGTDPALVRLRLAGPQEPPPTDVSWGFGVTPEQLAAVQHADVVVADWADKGAVWASLVVPPTTRLVVRAHGMDTFSLWPHLVDWSRVDALVTVSPHQGEVLRDVLRHGAVGGHDEAPEPVPVPNIVRLPPVPDPPARDPRALVLVGWAKRVKDPLWAVEVLAGLLARERSAAQTSAPHAAAPQPPADDSWRLVLVGDGFAPGGVATSQEYAAAFAERVAAPDVAGRVVHVPQTDDVAREVARVGFVLSASIRESFHQGLVEGVLGGAVPVVRDWPFFARRDGARALYPAEWVVDDVGAAVERIWGLREETDRAAAAVLAQAAVGEHFDPGRSAESLVRVVLGE